MSLFWELHQQKEIHKAKMAGAQAKHQTENMSSKIMTMQRQINRLALLNQAMWELVRETTSLTDEDILNKAKEIDIRDGALDGQIGGSVTACPECNRPVNNRHGKCLYCNTIVENEHVFST